MTTITLRHCETCGSIIDPYTHRKAYASRKYCSNRCYTRSRNTLRSQKNRSSNLKYTFVEMAGGCCQRCGYSEFQSGLDFHHIDKSQKEITPSTIITSGDYERIFLELDKCALLCKNCHMAFHADEWHGEFFKREGLGWTVFIDKSDN